MEHLCAVELYRGIQIKAISFPCEAAAQTLKHVLDQLNMKFPCALCFNTLEHITKIPYLGLVKKQTNQNLL